MDLSQAPIVISELDLRNFYTSDLLAQFNLFDSNFGNSRLTNRQDTVLDTFAVDIYELCT